MDVVNPGRKAALAIAALGALLTAAVLPAAAADRDAHARIAAERRALNDQLNAEEQGCRQRFVVTSCVEEARARHRKALAPLRQRELTLEDTERKQRVAERTAAVAAKQQAAAARPPASAPAPPRVRSITRPAPHAAASSARAQTPESVGALRATQAAERAGESAARRAEAAEAQARVAERQAKLDAQNKAKGKKPDPLPVPPNQ